VNKLAATDIDPYVPYLAASFEEYQVAKSEMFLRDIFPNLCEKFCRPWNFPGEYISISYLYKTRAINASFAGTA
jgi:hypothetical protein